jgi:hypothetical protein
MVALLNSAACQQAHVGRGAAFADYDNDGTIRLTHRIWSGFNSGLHHTIARVQRARSLTDKQFRQMQLLRGQDALYCRSRRSQRAPKSGRPVVGETRCDLGVWNKKIVAVIRARHDVQLRRHAGRDEPSGVFDILIDEQVDCADHNECRGRPARFSTRAGTEPGGTLGDPAGTPRSDVQPNQFDSAVHTKAPM